MTQEQIQPIRPAAYAQLIHAIAKARKHASNRANILAGQDEAYEAAVAGNLIQAGAIVGDNFIFWRDFAGQRTRWTIASYNESIMYQRHAPAERSGNKVTQDLALISFAVGRRATRIGQSGNIHLTDNPSDASMFVTAEGMVIAEDLLGTEVDYRDGRRIYPVTNHTVTTLSRLMLEN